MKKLLVLFALCMICSTVLVACEKTETPGTDATTQTPTTQALSTSPETTVPETTQAETTAPQTAEPVKVIAGLSWDTLSTVHPVISKPIVTDGGAFPTWSGIANIDTNDKALSAFGWVAYFTATEGTVGYSFNGGEHVYHDNFTYTAETEVQSHIKTNCPGAKSACRFQIDIPLEGLGAGTHKLSVFAKDTAGNEELIKEITLVIAQVDPVEELTAIEYDGTNGKITVDANSTVKFVVKNQGGKIMVIKNAAGFTAIANSYTLPNVQGNDIVQEVPGEGWDNFELTIQNPTDAAVEIELTFQ